MFESSALVAEKEICGVIDLAVTRAADMDGPDDAAPMMALAARGHRIGERQRQPELALRIDTRRHASSSPGAARYADASKGVLRELQRVEESS